MPSNAVPSTAPSRKQIASLVARGIGLVFSAALAMASSVRDIMTTEFEWIAAGDSVLAGGARLIELGFGRMPVRDAAGAFVGMLTLRDVVRVVTRGDDPARVSAGDVADSGISTVDVNESLEQALARLAAAGGGRLPVVEGPKLVGVISKAEV